MRHLLALVLAAGMLVVPAAAASASDAADAGSFGIRLVDAPVERRDDPRALSSIVDHLAPGATITRRVEVVSAHDEPITVRLAAGPAEVREGQFLALDEGTNDLVGWTTLEQAEVALDPGASALVPVTIAVPSDAAAGERYGVIWAAVSATGESGLTTVNRVGVRIYLSVGEGGEPRSEFVIVDLEARRDGAGRPILRANVDNSGGRAIDLDGELSLTDGPGGVAAGPFPAARMASIGPGAGGEVSFELANDLPDGPWTATVTLRSGGLEQTITAPVTFAEEAVAVPVAPLPVTTPERPSWPVVAIAFLLLLLVLAAILYVLLKRRRDDSDEDRAPQDEQRRVPVGV